MTPAAPPRPTGTTQSGNRAPSTTPWPPTSPTATTRQSAPVSVQIEGTTDTQPADPGNDETVVLVTNAAAPALGQRRKRRPGPGGPELPHRQRSRQGYALHTVHLQISAGTGAPSVAAAIHADGNPSYGERLYDLTGPGGLDAAVDVFTAPEDATLEPDTTYWLVIRRSSQTGTASLQLADSPDADDRSMTGFTLSSHLTETAAGSDSGAATRSVTRSAKAGKTKPVTQGATVRDDHERAGPLRHPRQHPERRDPHRRAGTRGPDQLLRRQGLVPGGTSRPTGSTPSRPGTAPPSTSASPVSTTPAAQSRPFTGSTRSPGTQPASGPTSPRPARAPTTSAPVSPPTPARLKPTAPRRP